MSEYIKKIQLIHNTVAGGAVWNAGSVLVVGMDVDENEAQSLLRDGLAATISDERLAISDEQLSEEDDDA